MKNKLGENLYESFMSVFPISMLILVIGLIVKMSTVTMISFLISSVLLILGMTLFGIGAPLSMNVIGNNIGSFITKKGKIWLILIISFVIGLFITISEPDLNVFAKEITSIPNMIIIGFVSLGIGLFLMLGVYRIIKRISYRNMMSLFIFIIMILLCIVPQEFISVAFDGGSVTTGPIGVPLIIAFGYGITKIRSDEKAKSDCFGLCGLASLGPIIIVLLLGLFFKTESSFDTSSFVSSLPLLERFKVAFINSVKDVFISITPISIIFIIYSFFDHNLNKKTIYKVIVGLIILFLGLSIFLTGASVGFMEMGYSIGNTIAKTNYKYSLIPLGMIIGFIIINVEPAVKILKKRISDLTEGSINDKMINLFLSIGVCFATFLALIRIFFGIPIIYIIVPCYAISGALMYYTPELFVNISYDSGGAASGAMTTTFLIPFCIGICEALGGNILIDAFGVSALVAVSPIITIQILGIIYNNNLKEKESNLINEEIVEYVWEG